MARITYIYIWQRFERYFSPHRAKGNFLIMSVTGSLNHYVFKEKYDIYIIYSEDEQQPPTEATKPGICRRIISFICGFSDEDTGTETINRTAEEQRSHLEEVISLQQDEKVKKMLWAGSAISILISVVFLVYYTVPDGKATRPMIDLPYMPFVVNGTRPYLSLIHI